MFFFCCAHLDNDLCCTASQQALLQRSIAFGAWRKLNAACLFRLIWLDYDEASAQKD